MSQQQQQNQALATKVEAASAASVEERIVKLFGVDISKKKMKSYKCKHCGMKFKTCQALGGHQNAHKRHRGISNTQSHQYQRTCSLDLRLTLGKGSTTTTAYYTPFNTDL